MANLFLLRHAQNESANFVEEQILNPSQSDPLSPAGRATAERAATACTLAFDLILSSSLLRAEQTATAFAERTSATKEILIDRRLNERIPPRSMTLREWKNLQIASYENPEAEVGGLESCRSHLERVRNWWGEFEGGMKERDGKNVLVVSHGGTIEHILRLIYDAPLKSVSSVFVPCDFQHFHHLNFQVQENGKGLWKILALNVSFE